MKERKKNVELKKASSKLPLEKNSKRVRPIKSPLVSLIKFGLFVSFLYVLYKAQMHFHFVDTEKCTEAANTFFSNSYEEARMKFLNNARRANAQIVTEPLSINHQNLFIDFAIIKGNSKELFIHVSGTHGVEGFAGSAIQSKVLHDWTSMKKSKNYPTVVLVHALNAYGFANNRRVNENNVDLNRNYLSQEMFDKLSRRDTSLYELLNPTLNPDYILSFGHLPSFLFKSVKNIYAYGLPILMKAIVEGQYKFPACLQYGGKQLQSSLLILEKFFRKEKLLNMEEIEKVMLLDVHTGLGPYAVDSLLLDSSSHKNFWKKVFNNTETKESQFECQEEEGGDTTKGAYRETFGGVPLGILSIFPSKSEKYTVTQEFGTRDGLIVLYNLIRENAATQHFFNDREIAGRNLRDVFYIMQCDWKNNILYRGEKLFWATINLNK